LNDVDSARRAVLHALGIAALTALPGCAPIRGRAGSRRIVVVGGGYGGATAARYAALWGGDAVAVTLVERDAAFVSCPLSNLVLGGSRSIADLTVGYDALRRHGIDVVRDSAIAVDAERRHVRLARGPDLAYDRLILSPGIDFFFDRINGLETEAARAAFPHAWRAGAQTVALRRQLEAMPDGGVFAIVIPEAPYRCPPGPYERACQVASYFKTAKPRAKVLVLDANEDITSKGPLFRKAWAEQYPGLIEYRPQHRAVAVEAKTNTNTNTVRFEFHDDVRADVLNVLPPMRAGAVAVQAGLATANARWCEVNFLDFESIAAKHVHVLGDSIQTAPLMPKSGHMANAQAKVAAAAIVAALNDWPIDPAPMLSNACYSFVDARRVVHIASVHAWDAAQQTYLTVPGSGGLSAEPNETEGRYAWNWAHTIWADMLA
jgi:sulfide dehydrogenase [flavocytochrome c] flavoprotein chain